jgi:hypothetical protein
MSSSSAISTPPSSPGVSSSFQRAIIDIKNPRSHIKTLPELIEFNAKNNANFPFCIQAQKDGSSTTISHIQLKQAILKCRENILATIPEIKLPYKNEEGFYVKSDPVALFGESGAELLIHTLSLVSMGVPV